MPTEKPRFSIIVDNEMLKEIDDYRFNNRFASRSAATVDLLKIALDTLKQKKNN